MKIKHAFLLFFTGALLGIGLSPFTSTKPQDIVQSVPISYATTPNANEVEIISSDRQSKFDMIKYLKTFDIQQEIMKNPKPKVLATEDEKIKLIDPTSLESGTKIVAFFGDSMVDTMGTDAPYFSSAIKNYYPNMNFNLFNYGIGAQQIDKALERVDSLYDYKDRKYEPVTRVGADIIILGSFAYNPYNNVDGDLERYKAELTVLIDRLTQTDSQVVFLATIAPLKTKFGAGPGGVNWETDTAYTHATKIQTYMEAAISVAKSKNIPVIDLYHATLQDNGEGIAAYVSTHDGIHPSSAGHNYIASSISAFVAKNKMF